MANYIRVAAPEGFNFGKPNEWPIWFKRFQRYRIASELSEKSESEQVNALIYIMGDKAEEILILFNLSEAQINDYKLVVSKFQDYFIGKRNVIYERAKFNRRSQGETEPVEEFITNLYVLAETCSYGILKEEMIRDRLVVGVKNFNLSEKLQLESELTLEKAIQIVRQSESVKNQQKEIRQDTEDRNVDVIEVGKVKYKDTKYCRKCKLNKEEIGLPCHRLCKTCWIGHPYVNYPEANPHTSDAAADVAGSSTSPGRTVRPPRRFGEV
ncbi:hypothetical protein LAZ67_11001491 [Cordylochernes scorpioides]|uniref:Gag protein n=1 Tax=Cordylochernes scorpioides TaxID=51811 RepID=A0ABY6KYX9_9ARAC|nr:hypothetical protein LAZ67_11001491 [Cordylochernes scorpioides]